MYVDDLSKTCVNDIDSKDMGTAITASLKQLKMEAHPDKSGLLVFGKKEFRDMMECKIDKNPTIVQDFVMGYKTNLAVQNFSIEFSF